MPASLSQALYAESKNRLAERLQSSIASLGSLARQVARGSKSSEVRVCPQFALPLTFTVMGDRRQDKRFALRSPWRLLPNPLTL